MRVECIKIGVILKCTKYFFLGKKCQQRGFKILF